MSDSLGFAVAIVFAEVIPGLIAVYGAFWAFSIRGALASRFYRNQALLLGAMCLVYGSTNFLTYSNSATIETAFDIYYGFLFVGLFAFIDSTIRVARRSDPLLRSILRWEKLRIALWCGIGVIAITNVFPVFGLSYANAVAGTLPGGLVWSIIISFIFVVGGAGVLIGARRSRDPVLRRSLKWLGVAIVLLFPTISATIVLGALGVSTFDQFYSFAALPGGAIAILLAYALYRSARSLAPITRLPAIESARAETSGNA